MDNELTIEELYKDKFSNSENAGAKVFINSIFHVNKNGYFTCLIKEEQYLVNLFHLLLECEDKEVIEIIDFLMFILKKFPQNTEVFMKISSDNEKESNFLTILIKKYLTTECNEIISILYEFIELIINQVSFDKSCIEFIFQELAKFYQSNQYILTENLLYKFIKLFKLLLGEKLCYTKPKNYFYLSGSSSIKVNEKILEEERIKLSNGAVFIFWFKIEKYPTYKINNDSTILRIKTNKSLNIEINLNLDKVTLKENFPKYEYKLSEGWNFFIFSIKPKNFFRDAEYVFTVNNDVAYFKLSDLECDCDIKELVFFDNFIGQISSIMFLNKYINEETTRQLNIFKYGFYSEKKLFQLLKHCNMNYMSNSNLQSNNLMLSKEFSGLNNIIDNLKILYTPSRFNQSNIYDATGKYHAQIISKSKFQNSVRNYICYQKNIFYLGGIKNFLPFFELIYSKNMISETSLLNYLELIQIIINSRLKNIRNCNENNFFTILSIFLEKLKPNIFTENILNKLIEIAKYLLSINDKFNDFSQQFFESIILNEQIFTKFTIPLQIMLWKDINELFKIYTNQMKNILKIRKLLIIVYIFINQMRIYDKDKYLEVCCENHYSLINTQKVFILREYSIFNRVEYILKIINTMICEIDDEKNENIRLLMNYLALDNSLCIQKNIISILYYYFVNKGDELIKYKKMCILIEYKMFEVIIYVYSVSSIDIKCILINFFKEISCILYKDQFYFKIFSDKILSYLVDCLFTDNLLSYELKEELNVHKVSFLRNSNSDYLATESIETKKGKNNLIIEISDSNMVDNEESSTNAEKSVSQSETRDDSHLGKTKDLELENKESYEEKYFYGLKKTYNLEIYNRYVQELYSNLFKWLLNLNEYSNKQVLALFDDNDYIVNHYVINIFINAINFTNITFLQRFLQDIHLLLMNNRENCLNLSKNNSFYTFLLEISYKYYIIMNNESDELNGSAITIYDLGKKIHTELILNTILREDSLKNIQMTKINYLLNWALKLKNDSKNYELNSFIRSLIRDLLILLVDYLKTLPPNVNNVLWMNFSYFSVLIYEFMTFHNLSHFLINEKATLNEINMDNIIVPRLAFSSLNLERDCPNAIISPSNRKRNSILKIKTNESKTLRTRDLWVDYILFEMVYTSLCHLWSLNFYENKVYTYKENKIEIYEKMIEDYILNKNRKDIFIEIFKILLQNFKIDEETLYNNNLIKVFSNLFSITISLLQNQEEILFWLEEYERFIIFLIISSSNMKFTSSIFYNNVQDIIADVVSFSICFLSDEYLHTRKGYIYEKNFLDCISNIFGFIVLMYDSIFNKINKKKTFKELINSVVKLNKSNDITSTACFKVFTFFFMDESSEELIKLPSVNIVKHPEELKKYVSELFMNEKWILSIFDNSTLKKRFKFLFDFNAYSNILSYRKSINKTYCSIISEKKLEPLKLSSLDHIEIILIGHVASYLELEFKKYYNIMFNEEKNKIFLYKSFKKKLFQWRGMWSDKKLYYIENKKLRFKIFNHYTSYYARPILIPILDMDYYLPTFTKFDPSKLFLDNENNLSYSISLDINKIIAKSLNFSLKSIEDERIEDNYLSKIYKSVDEKIKNIYQSIQEIINDNIQNYRQYELFPKVKMATDPKFLKFESVFDCCYVKLSHHIRGYFQITSEGIYLRPFKKQFQKQEENFDENEVFLNLEDYDVDRQTCYGSIICFHHKEKDIILYFWPIKEIKMVLKRRYYFKKKAFEIFTNSNKSYFFSFKNQQIRDAAINLLSNYFKSKREIRLDTKESKDKSDIIIGFENIGDSDSNTNSVMISHKIENWSKWKISNFELLMWLNLLGNRSYNDITQYPVFPWLVKNYKTNELDLLSDLRELNLPMGMIETENKKSYDRKKKYLEEYRESGLYSDKHRHYGSHYSNPLYVSHYLTRLFPLVQTHIELQGDKFDDPNRLFFSITNSFQSATTQQGDIRELTPEFFFLPETFLNINNLNMGKRFEENKSLIQVNDVEIPSWSQNDPYHFICEMKKILESEVVSSKIGDWIDLIFGYKQTGNEAEESGNVFDHISYENSIDLDKEDKSKRSFFMRSVKDLFKKAEFGMTPSQLFNRSFPNRLTKDKILKGNQVIDSKDLKIYKNNQKFPNEKIPTMLLMKILDNDKLMCIYNNNTINMYKFNLSDNKFNITVENKTFFTNEFNSKIHFKIQLYSETTYNDPSLIIQSGKVIVQGGYYDGRISVSYYEGSISRCYNYFTDMNFPITALAVDKKETLLYCGNKIGFLYVFKIHENLLLLHKIIYEHSSEIRFIDISDNLNILATSSQDGYANLYTYPQIKLFRSISSENRSIDYVLLSAYPLPSFIIFSKTSKTLISYSINGKQLTKVEEECNYMLSPQVFTSISFEDYLIYGTEQCDIKIRRLPFLPVVKRISLNEKISKNSFSNSVKCLDLNKDKKILFIWKTNDIDVTIIKEPCSNDK